MHVDKYVKGVLCSITSEGFFHFLFKGVEGKVGEEKNNYLQNNQPLC